MTWLARDWPAVPMPRRKVACVLAAWILVMAGTVVARPGRREVAWEDAASAIMAQHRIVSVVYRDPPTGRLVFEGDVSMAVEDELRDVVPRAVLDVRRAMLSVEF